jgi:hypothetical protein
LEYRITIPTEEEIRGKTPDLEKYLPPFITASKSIRSVEDSTAQELGRVSFYLEDLRKQLNVQTASWGLTLWEKELGMAIDNTKTNEFRRENIKAKFRGTGTVTKQMLQDVALAFTNAEVDILEYPIEYRVVLKFLGVFGIPDNMAGLINAMELIKPAHLLYSFDTNISFGNLLWINIINGTI